MNPFFTIIIPVYNCQNTVLLTLESVLNQSINDYEIIVIDDHSTDNTLQIVNSHKNRFSNIIIIENLENIGVAEARNKGIRLAKGKYIAFLDGDDLWMPQKLEKQKCLINETNCDICCSSYSFIDENSNDIKSPYIIPKHIDYKMMLKQNYIGCSTVSVRRDLLIANHMDKNYQHEDYALWLKLIRKNAKVIGVQEPLMKYRVHRKSRSFNKKNAAKGRMMIYLHQEKLGLLISLYYFLYYVVNGVKKNLL